MSQPFTVSNQKPFHNMRILYSILVLSFTLTSFAADWAQWRGPNRDGVNPEKGLAAKWPESGPKMLYKATGVGVGFSSVVINDGTLYTMGDLDDACYLFALDLKGNHKWKSRVGEPKVTVATPDLAQLQLSLGATCMYWANMVIWFVSAPPARKCGARISRMIIAAK